MESSRLPVWPLVAAGLAASMSFSGLAAVFIPLCRAVGISDSQGGLVLSLSGLLWMLTTTMWARVSNRYGRRFAISIGLIGESAAICSISVCVFFMESTIGKTAWAIGFFLGSRVFLSVFYGAIAPAINALIADNFPPEERTKPIASVGAGQGAGIVIGPAIVGLLSTVGIVWPLLISASLTLVAVLVLIQSTPKGIPSGRIRGDKSLKVTDPRLRRSLLTAFSAMLAIVCAQLSVGYLTIDYMALSTRDSAAASGVVLSLVGASLLLAQAFVSKISLPLRAYAQSGSAFAILGLIAAPYFSSRAFGLGPVALAFCVGAFGVGLLMPTFQSDALNSVEKENSSQAAGYVSASMAAATIVGPSAVGYLYSHGVYAPFIVVSALLVFVLYSWRKDSL